MKYNTVRIDINKSNGKNKWYFSITENEGDREITATKPNTCGFYHYPVSMSGEAALKKLRDCMVKAHANEIKRLAVSMMGLLSLEGIED